MSEDAAGPQLTGPQLALCRLCLCRTPVRFSLLNERTGKMLKTVAEIEVSRSDGSPEVPSECCAKCWLNLRLAYRIRQGFLRSEQRLRGGPPVKQECEFLQDQESSAVPKTLEEDYPDYGFLNEMHEEPESYACTKCSKESKDLASHEAHLKACKGKRRERAPKRLKPPASKHEEEEDPSDQYDEVDAFDDITSFKDEAPENYSCGDCADEFEDSGSYEAHLKRCRSKRRKPDCSPEGSEPEEAQQRKPTIAKPPGSAGRKIWKHLQQSEIVQTPAGTYRCEVCSKEFPTRDQTRNHWYTHTRRPCPVCKREISYTYLHKHLLAHSDIGQVCDLCGKTFKNIEGLRSHKFYVHHSFRYKCTQCGKEYMKKINLQDHINKFHNDGGPQFVCDTCGLKFYNTKLLRAHVRRMHQDKTTIPCGYCNKNFSSQHSLKTHVRQHTNETPFQCTVCGEGFRQNVSLRSHLKSKHGIEEKKENLCKVCGKGFVSGQAVMAHIRLHNL